MDFISHFGMFLLQTATLVIAVLFLIAGIISLSSKGKDKNKIEIKKINERYKEMAETINEEILTKADYKKMQKDQKKKDKEKKKIEKEAKSKSAEKKKSSENNISTTKKRIFVINFHGDIKASAVHSLRQEVTALLTVATPQDEILVVLESGGGVVHGYGLAASQLERIKQKKIPLTVAVDKVAASGGYLMACVADKIIAAPFAIIGSIGVIAQIPNFNRLLKKNHIDFEQICAGEFKRTLTIFGENSDKARHKMQEDVEDIHHIFKEFVSENRPQLDIEKVATGEHWLARKAFELKLVDELQTSDDYLLQAWKTSDLYKIKYRQKKGITEKLTHGLQILLEKTLFNKSGAAAMESRYEDNLFS